MDSNHKAILCLCHDEMTLRVRQLLLERFGYKVLATNSVEEVANIIRRACPDMLIIDNGYPGIDYEDAAGNAKAICPEMLAVVLAPSYAMRPGANGAVDRFLHLDGPREEWLAEIQSLFLYRDREHSGFAGSAC